MREGDNPNKTKTNINFNYTHQVIIPVFIPNEEGYFKDTFAVFKFCINSLINTSHKQTYISIINNGSCPVVTKYLDDLFLNKQIHEIIHTANIGKINAILKGLVGIDIELVTISDQDILFQKGWQSETLSIFNNFSKAGVVGLIPMLDLYRNNSENCILDYLFSNKMKLESIKDIQSMRMFYDSIWGHQEYDENFFKKILVVNSKNLNIAVVGSGHLVATYKRTIFNSLKSTFSKDLLSAKSEMKFLDLPPSQLGYYRLTTANNYAFHMGNKFEDWMVNYLPSKDKSVNQIMLSNSTHFFNLNLSKKIIHTVKRQFVKRIVFSGVFYKLFLRHKDIKVQNFKPL